MFFENTCISGRDACNAINAFLFSEANHTPLTAFFTVAWELISDFEETSLNERLGKLLHSYARWCRVHRIPCAYIRVMERGEPRGIHTHFLFHVTPRLFEQLIQDFPNWIEGYQHGPMVHFGNEEHNPDPKFHDHPNQRKGRLRYLLKGLDQEASINRGGIRARIAELLGIHGRRGSQGRITLKRVGISHSLGPINRRRQGFIDIAASEELGAAIASKRESEAA